MIDNNAFGVGAAAAVPTAGTPIARTVSPPRLTSPWSGALRKRYVISPVARWPRTRSHRIRGQTFGTSAHRSIPGPDHFRRTATRPGSR